jgi:hypothetical protein
MEKSSSVGNNLASVNERKTDDLIPIHHVNESNQFL